MSEEIKELYDIDKKFYLKDRYSDDEVNFYNKLLKINKNGIDLDNDCTISSSMGPIIKGANYYIDALRIFLSAPMDRKLHGVGVNQSIKYRIEDGSDETPIDRLYSIFGSNRVFNFKGKINNLELNDYIDNYDYMTNLIIDELISHKEANVFAQDNPLEPYLNETNIKLLIKFYQNFAMQYSIPEICAFANDKIKEEVEKLDDGTDDYIERSKEVVENILDKIEEHKNMYRLRLNEVNFLIKHLMAFRLLEENIGKEIIIKSNIFKKPGNPAVIKNLSEKRSNLTNLLLHQLQYYTEAKGSKIFVYINLNKELCTVLEEVLNNFDEDFNIENIDPDQFANKYIQNTNILEEYMINSMISDPVVGNGITNIYELLLICLKFDHYNTYFRSLMSLMYQSARFDGSYNLLEHIQSIMNTAIIELPNKIEEYEYNRYIRNIYESELIASNNKDNIMTNGTQNYLIPIKIGIEEFEYMLVCKIPEKDKSINMFDSNIFHIYATIDTREKYKEYKKRSYVGIPYKVSVNTQSYKDFESIVGQIPEISQINNKMDLDIKENYELLQSEINSQLRCIEELYINPNIYKFNSNDDFYKITKLIIDNFRIFYRDFSANQLELVIDHRNSKKFGGFCWEFSLNQSKKESRSIDIVPYGNFSSVQDIILKEYKGSTDNRSKDIDNKIKKLQGELDLLNIQLGIKDEFSWDKEELKSEEDLAGKYADEDLRKNFLKNKDNSEEEDKLLDVFADKDGE